MLDISESVQHLVELCQKRISPNLVLQMMQERAQESRFASRTRPACAGIQTPANSSVPLTCAPRCIESTINRQVSVDWLLRATESSRDLAHVAIALWPLGLIRHCRPYGYPRRMLSRLVRFRRRASTATSAKLLD